MAFTIVIEVWVDTPPGQGTRRELPIKVEAKDVDSALSRLSGFLGGIASEPDPTKPSINGLNFPFVG